MYFIGLVVAFLLVIGGVGNLLDANYAMDYLYGFGFIAAGIAIYFIIKPKKLTPEEMEFLKKAEEKEKNK